MPRRGTAASVWRDFQEWEGGEFPDGDVPLPVDPAYTLFNQTVAAFDSGLWDLAALGCRAALEAVGYTFLARRPIGRFAWRNSAPCNNEGMPRRVDYSEVSTYIRGHAVLEPSLIDALDRIKFAGDATAHIASRLEEEVDTLKSGGDRRPGAPTDRNQLWITRDDVLRNLLAAIAILKAVLIAARQERDVGRS